MEKNPFLYKSFRPDTDAKDLNVSAVDTIFWLPSCMIIFGGMPFNSVFSLSIVFDPDINTTERLLLPNNITPLHLIHSPVPDCYDTFLLLSNTGSLLSFRVPKLKFKFINDLFGGTEILCSKFYSRSNEGEELVNIIQNLSFDNKETVLNGGEVFEAPNDIYGLLVTGHQSGVVRFWSISTVRIHNILNISLLGENEDSVYENLIYYNASDLLTCKISCIEIFHKNLIVGFDLGKIAL